MEKVSITPFKVIGITIRTTNENQQGAKDIPALWDRFMSENIVSKIPNRLEDAVLSIYTNYESDYTKPYDTILGCKVSTLDEIPEGMIGASFDGGEYEKFVSKGDLHKNVVYDTWVEIWNTDLNRAYTADFEVYGEKSMDAKNAEVDILIAVK